nr:PREDICTED: kynurenine--oxoglutarate transaminase 3 isoform X1 [Bemisia tabaci]
MIELISKMLNTWSSLRSTLLKSIKVFSPIISTGCPFHCTTPTMATTDNKFSLPERYKGTEYSVWVEYIQLAIEHKPDCNLGQGFPDFPAPPEYLPKYIAEVTESNHLMNQYTRGFGHPRLVNAIADLYSKLIGRKLDPLSEILVTIGAYEALYCAIHGNVGPGDEVIIVEPYFDCYEPMTISAGGTPVFIPLRNKSNNPDSGSSADWVLDPDELAKAFNSKTKLFILNTPHNPLGKVFTYEELQVIADLCKKHNVICIADEVYEWLVYKPATHVRMATLPGMWERTITIGSAGKTFSATGWKLGWAYCPKELMKNMVIVHQNCVYTGVTPIQEAVARGFEREISLLGTPNSYFEKMSSMLQPKRDYFCQVLKDVGFAPTIPEGGYFVVSKWSDLAHKADLNSENDSYKDFKFTKWMTKNVKLQGIPYSAFYCPQNKPLGEDYVRYCFFKKDETLSKAESILRDWTGKQLPSSHL